MFSIVDVCDVITTYFPEGFDLNIDEDTDKVSICCDKNKDFSAVVSLCEDDSFKNRFSIVVDSDSYCGCVTFDHGLDGWYDKMVKGVVDRLCSCFEAYGVLSDSLWTHIIGIFTIDTLRSIDKDYTIVTKAGGFVVIDGSVDVSVEFAHDKGMGNVAISCGGRVFNKVVKSDMVNASVDICIIIVEMMFGINDKVTLGTIWNHCADKYKDCGMSATIVKDDNSACLSCKRTVDGSSSCQIVTEFDNLKCVAIENAFHSECNIVIKLDKSDKGYLFRSTTVGADCDRIIPYSDSLESTWDDMVGDIDYCVKICMASIQYINDIGRIGILKALKDFLECCCYDDCNVSLENNRIVVSSKDCIAGGVCIYISGDGCVVAVNKVRTCSASIGRSNPDVIQSLNNFGIEVCYMLDDLLY